jgi:hypothetical protein
MNIFKDSLLLWGWFSARRFLAITETIFNWVPG